MCALSADGALWHRLSYCIALLPVETFERRGPSLIKAQTYPNLASVYQITIHIQ